jgi:Phosphoesterase family
MTMTCDSVRKSLPLMSLVLLIGCEGCTFISLGPRIDTASLSLPCTSGPAAAKRYFDHVLIIVFENQDYADVIADPYFASLAKRGALFTNFHGLFHPSYSNYLAMVSGRPFRSAFDWQRNLKEETIGNRLEEAHLTWKNYAEGYGGWGCDIRSTLDNSRYARKHVPFMSFESARKDKCVNIVSEQVFHQDLQGEKLPNYMFYSPDLDHDGHDPKFDRPVGLIKASRWLERFLDPLLSNPAFTKRTLTIVTFDESRALLLPDDNHIYTVFLGEMVRPGIQDGSTYNHFNVLRTIEDNFGLHPLAEGDGCAKAIDGVWTSDDKSGGPPLEREAPDLPKVTSRHGL